MKTATSVALDEMKILRGTPPRKSWNSQAVQNDDNEYSCLPNQPLKLEHIRAFKISRQVTVAAKYDETELKICLSWF